MTEELTFPGFDEADLESIKSTMGISAEEQPDPNVVIEEAPAPPKRKRGRPRKSPLPTESDTPSESPRPISRITSISEKLGDVAPVGVDEKELAKRLENILSGFSSIPAGLFDREYFQMTKQEAQNIAVPAASYLVRVAPENAIAAQIIEQYDLAAIAIGLLAYFMRVVGARREEIRNRPPSSPTGVKPRAASAIQRISESQAEVPQQPTESFNGQSANWNADASGTIVPRI